MRIHSVSSHPFALSALLTYKKVRRFALAEMSYFSAHVFDVSICRFAVCEEMLSTVEIQEDLFSKLMKDVFPEISASCGT